MSNSAHYVQGLEVTILSWQCYVHEQVSSSLSGWHEWSTPRTTSAAHTQTNSWAPCRSALAGHWGTLCFGLVSSGLNAACASCMSLRSYCSPREPDLSTTSKLSHTTFAAASKASSPDVTSCYMHLIFVPQRLLVARREKSLQFFDLLAHH